MLAGVCKEGKEKNKKKHPSAALITPDSNLMVVTTNLVKCNQPIYFVDCFLSTQL